MKNPEHFWRCTFGFHEDLDPALVERAWWEFVIFVMTFRDHGWHVILKKDTAEITDPDERVIEVPASTATELAAALKAHRHTITE